MARQIDIRNLGAAPIPLHAAAQEWLEGGELSGEG
jgi:hypothetical protein